MRCKPGDESKGTQTRPDIIWEEEEDEGKDGNISKEAVSGDGPAIGRRMVLWLVKGSK